MIDKCVKVRTLRLRLTFRTLMLFTGTPIFNATKTQDLMATVFLVSWNSLEIACPNTTITYSLNPILILL